MSTSLVATVQHVTTGYYTSAGTLANGTQNLTQKFNTAQTWSTTGTKLYAGQRTTTGETLDLTSTLTDIFGNVLNFANVLAIHIENLSGTATLTISGGAANPFSTDQYTVAANGAVSIVTSYTITGTAKTIKIQPSVGTATYNIVVIGN